MSATPTPIPPAAIAAPSPTSRAVFRHLGRAVGATNRETDALRLDLIARIGDGAGSAALMAALRSLDEDDPGGALGAEARLAVWFTHAAQGGDDTAQVLVGRWAGASTASAAALQEVARLAEEGMPGVDRADDEPQDGVPHDGDTHDDGPAEAP